MGATQRKMKKKTRQERMDMHIQRLTLFNQNAMHEVGRLAQALRYYAEPNVWEGHVCPKFDEEGQFIKSVESDNKYVIWKGLEDGPLVARKILNSLGLPWDKFPTKDGAPVDPEQPGFKSVLKSAAQEVRAEKAGLEEDDRSEHGRYPGAEEEDKKAGVEGPSLNAPNDKEPTVGDYVGGKRYLGFGRWENS